MRLGVMLAMSAMALVALEACEDADVRLGPPNGLQGKLPTDPEATSDAGAGTCSTPNRDAGPGGDAAPCPTFTNDIFGTLMQPNVWGCTVPTCHGPAQPEPNMVGDASAVYETLTKYMGGNGRPYINPKCAEADQASFACDLAGATPSCVKTGPMPVQTAINHMPRPEELKKLTDWINCGSPR